MRCATSFFLQKLIPLVEQDKKGEAGVFAAQVIRGRKLPVRGLLLEHPLGDTFFDFLNGALSQYFEARKGLVYAIYSRQFPEVYKVGQTRLSLDERIAALNNESVIYPFQAGAAVQVHDRHAVERATHLLLQQQGVQRVKEFFKAELSLIEETIIQAVRADLALFEKQGFYILR